MSIGFMQGFDEALDFTYQLEDPTSLTSYPADFDSVFALHEGRQLGNCLRMNAAAASVIGLGNRIGLPTKLSQIDSAAASSTLWSAGFYFRKEVDTTLGLPASPGGEVLLSLPDSTRVVMFSSAATKGTLTGTKAFQISVQVTNGGIPSSIAGSALEPAGGFLMTGQWYYMKFQVFLHKTTGTLDLQVFDVQHRLVANYTLSNVDTLGDAASGADQLDVWFSPGLSMDDLIVAPAAAEAGEVVVLSKFPTADGVQTDWVASDPGSDNYEMIDDRDADNNKALDSNNNAAGVSAAIDVYAFENVDTTSEVPSTATFRGVQVHSIFNSGVSVVNPMRHQYRDPTLSGGAVLDFSASDHELAGGTTETFSSTRETNPFDASPWTVSRLNDGQFGVKLI